MRCHHHGFHGDRHDHHDHRPFHRGDWRAFFDHAREHLREAGRHGWRGGPFGGDRGDAFAELGAGLRGGHRRGGGRMFGHGDLRLLLLALIEQQPRHGYELIRTIEEMFNGQYSPSPGAIYPTLTMLEEIGHAEVQPEAGGRKRYAITDEGRVFLDENREAVEAVLEQTRHTARMAARAAMPEAVHKAMHALKHALLMRGTDWNKAEAQRVAKILERAASEIASGGGE
ncbi:PadR family transcriptional regulator [Dyella lutea]|uniref:PadR family transcriptional regulator n=1 Tax=Dyella lutea TaxID=2950441 RepID=A0ABT1F8U4_9GAMM|nr:PadR family transcriptional regulator [Dyella lutea]MCP1373795.1 PadR family transcriptional regulator [Dyella lutea]